MNMDEGRAQYNSPPREEEFFSIGIGILSTPVPPVKQTEIQGGDFLNKGKAMASIIDRTGRERNLPVTIKETGEILEFQAGDNLLKSLQDAVGGYIERVLIRPWDNVVMYVDEEGLLKGRYINQVASQIAGQTIVGDAVLMVEQEEEEEEEEDE